jgi:hypothetical protein
MVFIVFGRSNNIPRLTNFQIYIDSPDTYKAAAASSFSILGMLRDFFAHRLCLTRIKAGAGGVVQMWAIASSQSLAFSLGSKVPAVVTYPVELFPFLLFQQLESFPFLHFSRQGRGQFHNTFL